jgi:hypothetical protein
MRKHSPRTKGKGNLPSAVTLIRQLVGTRRVPVGYVFIQVADMKNSVAETSASPRRDSDEILPHDPILPRDPDALVDDSVVAMFFKVKPSTPRKWRERKIGPAYVSVTAPFCRWHEYAGSYPRHEQRNRCRRETIEPTRDRDSVVTRNFADHHQKITTQIPIARRTSLTT